MWNVKCTIILCVFILLPVTSFSQEYDAKALLFEHWRHYDNQGIACEYCHRELQNGVYTLPGHSICESCHKPGKLNDYTKVSKPICDKCHPKDDSRTITRLSLVPRGKRYFYHSDKLDRLCDICHGKMVGDEISMGTLISSRKERIRVRQKAHSFHSKNSCNNCHQNMTTADVPDNHTNNWGVSHAELAPQFNCRICHSKSFCQDCHDNTY